VSDCLSREDFRRFKERLLSPDALIDFHDHMYACGLCRSAYERYAGEDTSESLKLTAETHTAARRDLHAGAAPADTEEPLDGGVCTESAVECSGATDLARHAPKIEGYRITGVIGQGGMGIVYRAVQIKLNRTVALKVLPAMVGSASPSAVSRFRQEATAAGRLHHSNIVPIYDFGESRDAYYYAMELINGQPLNVLVRRLAMRKVATASHTELAEVLHTVIRDPSGTDAPPQTDWATTSGSSQSVTSSSGRGKPYYLQVARWMADAADALDHAHSQGIIHRDIKPANLIVATDGRIMVADFGLAKDSGQTSVTMTGSLMGTLRYMSPEQAMAKRVRTDHRTDVYSLGATMYELLCFQPAFTGQDDKEVLVAIIAKEPTPPRKITPTVPQELETICLKTLEKSPDARYDTARALAEDLRRFTHDLPIVAKRPGTVRRMGKFVRRHRAATIAVTAATLLIVVGVFSLKEQAARRIAEAGQRVAQVEALHESGMFFGERDKWREAETEFKKALAISPDYWPSLLGLARAWKEAYNASPQSRDPALLEQAEAACRRARELAPGRAEAINLHGVILKMLARYDEAVEAFRQLSRNAK